MTTQRSDAWQPTVPTGWRPTVPGRRPSLWTAFRTPLGDLRIGMALVPFDEGAGHGLKRDYPCAKCATCCGSKPTGWVSARLRPVPACLPPQRTYARGWDGADRRSSQGSPSPRVHPLPVADIGQQGVHPRWPALNGQAPELSPIRESSMLLQSGRQMLDAAFECTVVALANDHAHMPLIVVDERLAQRRKVSSR